ncbi:MAG: tetratricopeptide repeat protein [Bacteroidales bacterium]|nr:tetratricopeptide repeat protein [Bacteroidales bacterium]
MKIKYFLFIIIVLLADSDGFAKKTGHLENDSIIERFNVQSVDYLLNIAREKAISDFDSAEYILLTANRLADSLKETEKQVNTLILLGHLYFDNAYFESAEEIFNRLLREFQSELTEEQYANVKHTLGLNHIRFNNYDKAINFIQEALFYYEQENNKAEIARALKDIGGVYYYLGNENSALDNYQKALLIYREVNDSDGIARSYNNIGMIFRDKGSIELALDYLNRSLEIKKTQNNLYGIANTLGNMGEAYVLANQHDEALEYYYEALKMWIELDYLHGITEVYNYLGNAYIKKREFDKAIENLLKGQEISLKNNFKQRLIVNYQLLSEAYFEKQDYLNSISNYREYNSLKDSVYESISNQRIEEYKIKYENLKSEKELADQDQKILNQRYQIIITMIVLVGVVIFLVLLILQNKLIRKKSKKIQNINKELDKRVNERTSELRISQFSIDIAVDAIFWIKKDGKFIYINNSASSMLGYTKDEFIEMSIFDIVPEFSEDVWNEYWEQLKKKRSYVIQLYYKTRMGNEIPVEAAFNFREFEGEEFNFVFSRNITERKISDEKLKNAKDKAERSDILKSAFLANMSHEIRTPMNAIIGFINLLGDSEITPEQKDEIIELAQSSSYDLLNIINDIIDISKIEADELSVNKSLHYVSELLKGSFKFYLNDADYIKKENLKLNLSVQPNNERIAIFTDKARFRQVMNNLVNNAIKFTNSGKILIGYNQITQGGRKLLKFFVRDTGPGIPEDKIDIIFDRFNQVNDGRKKLLKGTGLGLSISKKLIDLLGGAIGVDSQEGIGSEFYFTLPYQILDNPYISDENEIPLQNLKNWSDKTILIVEDTPSNYYLIENYLKPTNAKLFWAKTGKEALDLFNSENHFDLVLMDIQLPGINGYEATKLIKAHNKDVPVIAQTAYALSGEKEHSINEGCDDYISKPIKKEMLLEILTKYLK